MLARIANMKVDPEELMKRANNSGLVRYLFGDDLQGWMRVMIISIILSTVIVVHTRYLTIIYLWESTKEV